MTNIQINAFEEIHHICLMYGLKMAYARFPFLVNNPVATPPPFRRNPKRPPLFMGTKINPVCVQYYGKDITILYNEAKVSEEEIVNFAKAVMEEYLHLRHPYMKRDWNGNSLTEPATGHLLAEIR